MKRLSLLVAIAAGLIYPIAAFAQDIARTSIIGDTTTSVLETLPAAIATAIAAILVFMIREALRMLVEFLKSRTALNHELIDKAAKEAEKFLVDRVHNSAFNGIKGAITQSAWFPTEKDMTPPKEVLDLAVKYVEEKNAGDIKNLNLSHGTILDIVFTKVPDVISMIKSASEAVKVQVPAGTKVVAPAKPPATKAPVARSKGK